MLVLHSLIWHGTIDNVTRDRLRKRWLLFFFPHLIKFFCFLSFYSNWISKSSSVLAFFCCCCHPFQHFEQLSAGVKIDRFWHELHTIISQTKKNANERRANKRKLPIIMINSRSSSYQLKHKMIMPYENIDSKYIELFVTFF